MLIPIAYELILPLNILNIINNCQIEAEATFKDGKKDSKWTEWDENGQIRFESNYKDGECVSGDCDYFK